MASPVPLAWLKGRIKRDKKSPTGFVWLKRPRSDFKADRDARAWNSAYCGQPVGTVAKDAAFVQVRREGRACRLDLRALVIAFDTGHWPAGKLPPLSEFNFVAPRRERVNADHQGEGVLAQFFADHCGGNSADDLTVLDRKHDPFRLDIPTLRRDADWFARHFETLIGGNSVHLRHVHYVFSGANILKPNGERYRNTYSDWRWLLAQPAKAARWLGLVPWERIVDARNEAPLIYRPASVGLAEAKLVSIDLEIPNDVDVTPNAALENFAADQEFALAAFCEKSAVEPIMRPLAERFGMDLFIGVGDLTDSLTYEIAKAAHFDRRKLVLFTVCDCDPGGWNMTIALARKLQGFAVSEFPRLKFEVVRAGLTPEQARELGLPSAPLKPSEARADRWRGAFGIGQTELDSAMALKRDEFAAMIEAAIEPYFDETLDERAREAGAAWLREAAETIAQQVNDNEIGDLQTRYDYAREEIENIARGLDEIAGRLQLSDPPDPPEPDMEDKEERRHPLIDSEWGFVEGSLKLKADKAYENGEEDAGDDDDA